MRIVQFLLALVILVACGSMNATIPAPTTPSGSADVPRGNWQLISLNGQNVTDNKQLTLIISNGQISGHSGCNQFNGQATFNPQMAEVSVSPLASTKMACADAALNQQEMDYLKALQTAKTYGMAGENLSFFDEQKQQVLVFKKASATTGGDPTGSWQLVTINGQPALVANGKPLTLDINGKQAGGNGGCNQFGGNIIFDINNNTITISELISTMMACADDQLTRQESTYTMALQNAKSYTLNGDELSLLDAEGKVLLVFKRMA